MMRPTKDTGIARVLAVLLFGYLASVASAQDLTLPQQGTDPVVLHVPNDTPDARMLTVYLSEAKTPIAGRHMITDGTLSFVPAFGFEPGRDYEAHVDAGGDVAQVAFHIPDQREVPPYCCDCCLSKRGYTAGEHVAILHPLFDTDAAQHCL